MYAWMLDPEVSDSLGLRSAPTPQRTIEWIRHAVSNDSTYPFAILLDGEHVGNVVLDRVDQYLSCARLSIYIGESNARGVGIGTVALGLALKEAFWRLQLSKVWLIVCVGNDRAIQAYRRSGFSVEGTLRDGFRLRERLVDALYMAILRKEFCGP